jgi:hypothetical protein
MLPALQPTTVATTWSEFQKRDTGDDNCVMKRKTTPFAGAPRSKTENETTSFSSSSNVPLVTVAPVATSSKGQVIESHSHAFSISFLANLQVDTLVANGPVGLLAVKFIQAGLAEVTIQSGRADGYGVRSWPFRIGGVGPIYYDFASPIAVRCSASIAHSQMDDSGFVDSTFWKDEVKDISLNPSILDIIERLVEILDPKYGESLYEGERSRWLESESYSYRKTTVIKSYSSLAQCRTLVDKAGIIQSEWLSHRLRDRLPSEWIDALEEISPGIFAFDLFCPEFCDLLVAEVDNYEATVLPRRRPNSMNKYGLILNEIGMEPLMNDLLTKYVGPLCKSLYPDENVAVGLDHHHSFVVVYNQAGDNGLGMHHDASEVTLNVCLGKKFEGSGLVFCGRAGQSDYRKQHCIHSHLKGRAVIHLGRQRHGADNITSGERINLIMWARSSAFRCAAVNGEVNPDGFPRMPEEGPPDELCLSRDEE